MKRIVCIIDKDLQFLKKAEAHFSGDREIELKTFSSPDQFWKELPHMDVTVTFVDSDLDGALNESVWHLLADKAPKMHRVLLTAHNGDDAIAHAIRTGGSGCVPKREPELLRSAVQLVISGGTVLAPAVAVKVAQSLRNSTETSAKDKLTPREKELLAFMVQGLTMQKAGNSMGISINTVRSHIKSVYRKLEVHDKSALFRRARDMGLL